MPFTKLPSLFLTLSVALMSCDTQINHTPNAPIKIIYSDNNLKCSPFQSPCYIENRVGRFDIYIVSEALKAEEPFKVVVKFTPAAPVIPDIKIENTNIDVLQLTGLIGYMEGKDMFMGKIPIRFIKKSDEVFIATAIVAACHTDKMIWKLIITAELENNNKERINSFPFVIEFEASR